MTRSFLPRCAAAAIGLAMIGCGGGASHGAREPARSAPAPAPVAWISRLDRDHPLVGRLWRVKDEQFVDEVDLTGALGDYVLLGEKHDNPDHHVLQARVLRALVARGRRPAVAFEMFDLERQGAIDAAIASAPRDTKQLAEAASWATSGWPPWETYAPIAAVALEAGLPIVATGLSRATTRAMMKTEGGAVDEGEPLTPELRASLSEELRASHCGQLPETMVPGMIRIQRARDASMAKAMKSAADKATSGGVLVAGTGHTRTDRGAARDLAARDPKRKVTSVAFVEVDKAWPTPRLYASRFLSAAEPDKPIPFDFVWFTPRISDDDPCADFGHPPSAPATKPAT